MYNLAFNFYAEINIDNSKLWNLMLELSNELPNEVSLIFNHTDSESNFGKYSDKTHTLEFLNNYKSMRLVPFQFHGNLQQRKSYYLI